MSKPPAISARPETRHNQPVKSSERLLDRLHGVDEVIDYGRALALDLAAFSRGEVPWNAVQSGVILAGPPGTGKTTAVKAIAETCGVKLVATSYAAWQKQGEGNLGTVLKAMADAFSIARQRMPSILFIDEIDSIIGRGAADKDGWWSQITNALLELIDGADEREGVVVIGATNRPEMLDPALVRSGRLERRINVMLPDEQALSRIFAMHLAPDIRDRAALASLGVASLGKSGADVTRIVRDARRSARHAGRMVTIDDVVAILHPAELDSETMRRIAIHEAGHAVVALRLGGARQVSISLSTMGDANPFTAVTSPAFTGTREMVETSIAVMLGGRVAELAILGRVTAGSGGSANSDLARANRLAFAAVGGWGLAEQGQPLLWLPEFGPEQASAYPAFARDAESLLERGHERALATVNHHRQAVLALADALVVRRALSDREIRDIVLTPERHQAFAQDHGAAP